MLRRFRARTSCWFAAALLVIGTVTTACGELLHAGSVHDAACMLDAAHDASSHRVAAPGEAAAPDLHCVGCHFARTPRIGAHAVSYAAHAAETRPVRPAAEIGAARAAILDNLPPRSPPAVV